jgi:hypothetical protein
LTIAFDMLSEWAPALVLGSLVASLLGVWTNAAEHVFNSLAIIIGGLALALLVARGMREQFRSKEELGFTRTRDLVAYKLAGKGMPRGSYFLAIAGFATWLLTGVQSSYGWLAFSAFALSIAWIKANVRYPADRTR